MPETNSEEQVPELTEQQFAKDIPFSKYPEINILSCLLGLNLKNIKNAEFSSELETSINLKLDNKFKITDRKFSVNGKINNLNLKHNEVKSIKKFIPLSNSKITLKDTKINFEKDIEIIDIIKPTNKDEWSRMNPICSNPIIKIRKHFYI